jgi:hypothetical protein
VNAITHLKDAEADLHEHFRSRLIDRIARIEAWVVERLIAAGVEAKKGQLLSQRMDAFRACVRAHPSQFKSTARVLKLLDELEPYLMLRSALAHSAASTLSARDGTKMALFETPCLDPKAPWRFRTALREGDIPLVLQRVSSLANQLKQQVAA